jgi:hypothetical protein
MHGIVVIRTQVCDGYLVLSRSRACGQYEFVEPTWPVMSPAGLR